MTSANFCPALPHQPSPDDEYIYHTNDLFISFHLIENLTPSDEINLED